MLRASCARIAVALVAGTLAALVVAPATAQANPESDPIRYDGQRGQSVWCVQEGLRRYAGFTGAVDGVYGPQTRQAVINLQKVFGLQADGIVGQRTGEAIRTMFYLDGPPSYIEPKLFWEANCQPWVPTVSPYTPPS